MGFLTHLGQSSYQIGFVFLSLFFVPFSNEAFPSIFSRFFFFSISFPGHRAQKKKMPWQKSPLVTRDSGGKSFSNKYQK